MSTTDIIIDVLIILSPIVMGGSIALWRSRAVEPCPDTRAPWRPERRATRRAMRRAPGPAAPGECFAWGFPAAGMPPPPGGRS